jgi:hypothetical protein
VAACVLCAGGARAFAQAPPPSPTDAGHDPGFVTIDRFDATTRMGVELGYLFPDHTRGVDITVARFDVHLHWVDDTSRLGAYGALPVSYMSVRAPGTDSTSVTPVGDLEGGVLYMPRTNIPNMAIVFRLGLTLPTASTGSTQSALSDQLANLYAAGARWTDAYLHFPSALSLRVGASVLVRSGVMFARFDLGLDDNRTSDQGAVPPFLRLNAGVGVDLGQIALMGETANLYVTSATGTSIGSSWVDTASLSARFRGRSAEPYVALTFPLDHDANSYLTDGLGMTAVFTIGVEARR